MYITRDYSILVWNDLKLQPVVFNLSPYLKRKPSRQLPSLGSHHWSGSMRYFKGSLSQRTLGLERLQSCGKVHLRDEHCCPSSLSSDTDRAWGYKHTSLISSLIPHLFLHYCCVYVPWRKRQVQNHRWKPRILGTISWNTALMLTLSEQTIMIKI